MRTNQQAANVWDCRSVTFLALVALAAVLTTLFAFTPSGVAVHAASNPTASQGQQQWPTGLYQAYQKAHPRVSGTYSQTAELTATDYASYDYFGESVAVSSDGTIALIGAYAKSLSDNTQQAGASYIFIKSGNTWVQLQELTASNHQTNDYFGSSVALSSNGNVALIAAKEHTNYGYTPQQVGAVYFFVRSGSSWIQTQEIIGTVDGDGFGDAVSLTGDGSTAFIGVPNHTTNGNSNAGQVLVYNYNGTNWVSSQQLTASDASTGDSFGQEISLSADGSTALIGAINHTVNNNSKAGSAYVFTKNGSNWSQTQELVASDGNSYDSFGSAVSLSADGSTALIGAAQHLVNSISHAGSAYVFTKNGSNWVQIQELTASDGSTNDYFGTTVSLSADGSTILVGADYKSVDGKGSAGTGYIFTKNGSNWSQTQELTALDANSDDYFTNSVGLSADGSEIVIGAYDKIINGNAATGAAYIFTAAAASNPAPVAQISAIGGTPQTAQVVSSFSQPLKAQALDANGNGVAGVSVLFTAPSTGASGTFANSTTIETDVTDSSGVATSSIFTANSIAGSYSITATVQGVASYGSFALTNSSQSSNSGVSQLSAKSSTALNAFVNTTFSPPLQVLATDNNGNPVPNVAVMFSAPNSGASGTFANGSTVEQDTTNSNGIATATFTANSTAGLYQITASTNGVSSITKFSLSNVLTSTDADGDGIPDIWETQGVTITTASGPQYINLPAMGADPTKPDIFLQVDWMQDTSHNEKLDPAALKIVHDAFAAHNINLHIDEGPDSILNYATGQTWGNLSQAKALPFTAMLGSESSTGVYDWSAFDNLKNSSFTLTGRTPIFHYAISINDGPYLKDSAGKIGYNSGISNNFDNGNGWSASEYLVSLGDPGFARMWKSDTDRIWAQAGTLMHELGHNLGLHHGGGDDVNNKPNYLSIMNYSFQLKGLYKNGSYGYFDYSESQLPSLDENNLNENAGLGAGAAGYGTTYFCNVKVMTQTATISRTVTDATRPIDFNCDDKYESSVSYDINQDGVKTALSGFDDWDNLKFKGGAIGSLGNVAMPETTQIDEPTEDQLTQFYQPTGYTYYLPFLGNGANGYTSYLAFQNVGGANANFTLKFFDSTGAAVSTPNLQGTCATLAANAECIPGNPFASGKSGSGVITSDQPLNVIVAEGTPFGGSAYAVANGGSNNLVAPIILKNAYGDFNTRLTIFNGGSSPATVAVTFYAQNGNVQSAANQSQAVAANTAWTLDQATSSLPANFNGWATISSSNSNQLVAQVLEQSQSQKFVAIANAQPSSKAAATLYAPAIFKGAFGFVTGANIVNPNASPVQVSITYYDDSGKAYTAPAFTLGANSLTSIYQSGSGNGLPTSPALPSGFSGAAIIKSTGGNILMVVNESGGVSASGTSLSGVYAAASSGSGSVGLPVMANGGYGYTTGATILNTSGNTVSGSIQYYNPDGTPQGNAHSFSIAPYASQLAYQGDPAQGLPTGSYGSAILTENGGGNDLIVTTNAESGLFYTYTEPNQ